MTRLKVRDVMTSDVAVVREDAPYREIADVLAEREVNALPVLNTAGAVVGVVSEADLLHKIEFQEGGAGPRLFGRRRYKAARGKSRGDHAADLMTTPPVTTRPDASLVEAARQMEAATVKCLPVVDDLMKPVGVVSRRDLIQVFLLPDPAIRDEVVEQVVRRTPWVSPEQVTVTVQDGVVTLTGRLGHPGMVDLVGRLTLAVDGVVDVVNQLTADAEDTAGRSSSQR